MVRSIWTSRISSPPADLRPAPLRIPLRRTAAAFDDGPGMIVTKDEDTARDALSSISFQRDPSQYLQTNIPRILSEQRDPRSTLGSLVSRFEILDAVNSVDTSLPRYLNSSYKPRPSTIPRAIGCKRAPRQDHINQSPLASRSRASSELSPRQIRTPVAVGPRSSFTSSTIPVLRHSQRFITSKETPASRLRKSKSFRKNNPSSLQSSPASAISVQAVTKPSPIGVAPQRQETPQRLRKDLNLLVGSSIGAPQQRPSVADLRKSFEKFSQPVEPLAKITRPSLNSKSSRHSTRQSQDMAPSPSRLRLELLRKRPPTVHDGGSYLNPPLFGKGHIVHVRRSTNATEISLPQCCVGGSVRHGSSLSLTRSRRPSLREFRQEETSALNGPMKLKASFQPGNEKIRQESEKNISIDALMDGLENTPFGEQQGDGALVETPKIQCEGSVTEDTSARDQSEILGIPIALSPGNRPTQGGGKVLQLRRFFERSSKILSSPLSLMHSRSILEPEEGGDALMGDDSASSWDESESPRSTNTLARRISIVPSLTTEISVNDFFCDFVGSPSYEESPITASPIETTAKMGFQMKPESPVKHRIQQFEHLSRDSLKVGSTTQHNSKHNDAGLPSGSKKDNRVRKRSTVGSWRPIHQKGVAIWRKISGSLSRSLDSWKDCNSDHEHIDLAERRSFNTNPDHSTLPANGPEHGLRHLSPFGYSMYRVTHTSRRLMTPLHAASSIQLGDRNTLNKVPRRTLNDSDSHSSPGTPPPLVVRKSFPIIGRVSSGLRWPGGFGLDGHFPSKPVQEEGLQPSDMTISGPSTPQGDPDALLKVMLKQSAAERSRRREDEKHLRRDKKLGAFAIWKGKGKADVVHHSADNADHSEQVSKKHEKGKWKGKEKEILRKNSKENEGQSSTGQENETNKKTESGFVVFESKDVKLRHPKPRRPGQVRKVANMYKEKGSSGVSVNTKASSRTTLKEDRQSFRQKASSALGLRSRKGDRTVG
ncbi:hypothetical protein F5Y12DRAFT_782541 [Xylaria sp. FL1777]|nr:hypothetical protein F5Y12DRAFT_782541 [Xylaria sp. FL1777]